MGESLDCDICVLDMSGCDIFATGVELPEFFGDFVRIVFYSDRHPPIGPTERTIVAKVILPMTVLIERVAAYQGAVAEQIVAKRMAN